jgi:hypothetical protein
MADINAAIRAAGVIWHPCVRCGLDWPFPKGYDPAQLREFLCHVCVTADAAHIARLGAALARTG